VVVVYLSLTFFLVLLVFVFRNHKVNVTTKTNKVIKTVMVVNKDTGQTLVTDSGQTPESYNSSSYVTILGLNKLAPAGMTISQVQLVSSILTNYININLKRQYTQASILNSGFTSTSSSLSAQLKLGNSQTIVNLNIDYQNPSDIEVIISGGTNGTYYDYNSGEQTVTFSYPQATQ
jgi:hypothetical protein